MLLRNCGLIVVVLSALCLIAGCAAPALPTALATPASPPVSDAAATPPPQPTATPNWTNAPFKVTLEPLAGRVRRADYITWAPDSSSRLFVGAKHGAIRIYKQDKLVKEPFLDVRDNVLDSLEAGFQSFAFAPDFATSGHFYVMYNHKPDGDLVLERYTVSDDPDLADPKSAVTILKIPHSERVHNGGQLRFGPDGYLYISVGDNGGEGKEYGKNGQLLDTLLGKILRIDVSKEPYAIPPTNPFVNRPDVRPEIWAYGLRNPWRIAFDHETNGLYFVDVGASNYEEVDYQPATSHGGENYAWSLMEGNHCYAGKQNCQTPELTMPIFEYPHDYGCAVVGGVVYRGEQAPQLQGHYLFADFCLGHLWEVGPGADGKWDVTQLAELKQVTSAIGEDAAGNIYAADYNAGKIYRLKIEPKP